MLDISFRSELPGKILVYMDGYDARVFKRLVKTLGSEEYAQNAILLTGLLSDSPDGTKLSPEDEHGVKASFNELVGLSYEEFVNRSLTL